MKKILFSSLLVCMLLTFNNKIVYAENLTTYKEQIKNGDIRPPHYRDNSVSGPNPTEDEWIESLEKQYKDKNFLTLKKGKTLTINKVDQDGKPIPNVLFKLYKTRQDAEREYRTEYDFWGMPESVDLSYDSLKTDENGKLSFDNDKDYYIFVKETETPKEIKKSEEIVLVRNDNGVRFIGEKEVSKMKVDEATDGQNLNEYLQGLCEGDHNINEKTDWLVFDDNGTEKLVPKLPLKYEIRKDQLKNLIYGDENPEFVNVDGKKYVIRIMRGLSDRYDPKKGYENTSTIGSEWNRLILPIIGIRNDEGGLKPKFGRFGSGSKRNLVRNMPVLAKYTWWTDFGGDETYGFYRITQNKDSSSPDDLILRGGGKYLGAAGRFKKSSSDSSSSATGFSYSDTGWQPLLEEVKE